MSNNNNQPSARPKILGPALRTVLIMIAVVGVAYPLVLIGLGQEVLPTQSHGSMIRLDDGNGSGGRIVGSSLIGQEFQSPKFFHGRLPAESTSGVDPNITPEQATSQIENVSASTGIPQNYLKTMIELNVETNKADNLSAFAPPYVNVLELNLELVRQYPTVYGEVLGVGQ